MRRSTAATLPHVVMPRRLAEVDAGGRADVRGLADQGVRPVRRVRRVAVRDAAARVPHDARVMTCSDVSALLVNLAIQIPPYPTV